MILAMYLPPQPTALPPYHLVNKLNHVTVAIVLGAIFLVAGFYLGQICNRPTVSDQPPVTNSPTTGWQTYRNDGYGFEIKHPSDFITSSSQILASADLDGLSDSSILKASFPKSYSEGTNLNAATVFAGAKK